MSFKSFLNKKVQKMDWLDIGLVKWSCIALGALLATLIPTLAEINIWWFIILIVVLGIRPFYRVYFK